MQLPILEPCYDYVTLVCTSHAYNRITKPCCARQLVLNGFKMFLLVGGLKRCCSSSQASFHKGSEIGSTRMFANMHVHMSINALFRKFERPHAQFYSQT